MKKLLGLLCVGAVMATMTGCTTGPVSPPTISIDAIGSISIGSYKNVTGKISADTEITSFTCTIESSAGATVPSTQIEVTWPNVSGKSFNFDATNPIKITVHTGAIGGDYKLRIQAEAGASTDNKFAFAVSGQGGTPVTTSTINLGSYTNTSTGSSVDLDANPPSVMLAAAATAAGSGVDLVGTYSTSKSALRIFNPVYAADSSNITAFSSWSSPAATSFVKVTGTAFSAITTVEQIQPLYAAGTPMTSASVATGDVYVVKTDQGKYVAIEIGAFTTATDGTWTIKGSK